MHERPRFPTLLAVYGSALLNGLAVVSFPASANELKTAHGFSDAQYGAIFLPQVALTILGSAVGGALARRVGLIPLLRAALLAFMGAQTALAFTAHATQAAYVTLLAGTALVGLGFGLAAAPLNTLPGVLFPRRADSALVALHTIIGAGFAAGPLLFSALAEHGLWQAGPIACCVIAVLLLVLSLFAHPAEPVTAQAPRGAERPSIAPFLFIAVLYAFAEGTFSNWATVYLHEERALSNDVAALALTLFWASLVLGRLLVAALLVRVPATRIWLTLPLMMALAFLLLPSASGAVGGCLLFALAGLGAGAFFPLTVNQAVLRAPGDAARISAAMTAALMLGVGLGSFLVGPLRSQLSIAHIYLISCVYPLAAEVLALRTLGALRPSTQKSPEAV